MRCGLRVTDALGLPGDCIVRDANGAPYLRYYNHKMRREALVPVDEELERAIGEHRQHLRTRWPQGTPRLFPKLRDNPGEQRPVGDDAYRKALHRWLARCDIRDEHCQPVHLTPHQWRHTLSTQMINQDVPEEVVRRILDHDSHRMTARYARLSDATIRRHWEAARRVNISGETVTLDPDGPLAEAAWASQRVGRATQALPNGYCGLPAVKAYPHANALPDLPDVRHHPAVPAPAPPVAPAGHPDHLRRRGPRPAAAGRDEPARARQPRPDQRRAGNPGGHRGNGGGGCALTTPRT